MVGSATSLFSVPSRNRSGYYKGAVTIGVVIHGWSYHAGHGLGVTTILSAKPGKIVTKIDSYANIAYYLGIEERPKK